MQGVMRPSVKYRNKRYGITMRRVKVYEVETLGNPIQGRAAACPRRYDLFRFKIIQSHFHLRRSTCIRIDCVSNFQLSIGICIEVIIRIEPRHAYYFKTCIIVTCGQVVVVFRNRRTSRVSVQVVIINGWRRIYTDIDTVCESNELTADVSSILHSEEDYLLLSYVVDSNIEITKELKDGGWDHLILTNPQWIDRFGDPSKLKPVEYGSLANSMQEFLDVQMPILTADGNVLPDGVGLYQYDGETLLAFPVHVALGAAEPIEAKNPLIILVDKPAQSLKASSCMLPLTSSGNVLFAEGEKLQESFDESKLIDYGSIEEFQMNH